MAEASGRTQFTARQTAIGLGQLAEAQPISAQWVPPGKVVHIQNIAISAGLFWLGARLSLPSGRISNQYTIDPRLPAHLAQPDVHGKSMTYFPSYAAIQPGARRAFLDWMAGGRKDPNYGIGYVFLFLYGLEHRQFMPPDPSIARVLVPEVERLLSIYGEHKSFRHYASNFLFYARLLAGIPMPPPSIPPQKDGGFELSPDVRLYLGQRLSASSFITAHDALLWILALPEISMRTAVTRCFEQFSALWRIKFQEKYPEGFPISIPARRLRFIYKAASNTFDIDIPGAHTHYPDIGACYTTSFQTFTPLKVLMQDCTDDLDEFSRFVGRHPDQIGSLQATVLLPPTLRQNVTDASMRSVGGRMAELMGSRNSSNTRMREVLKTANFTFPARCARTGKLPQVLHAQLADVLDMIDVAIEPDPRYGGNAPLLDDHVVIFKAEDGGPVDALSPRYQTMRLRINVEALAAAADGDSTTDELQTIIGNIDTDISLTKLEKLRLTAYAIAIFKNPPTQAKVMRGLSRRPKPEREAIARAAVAVITTPGTVSPQQVRFLEKLHKTLGLDADTIYTSIHRAGGDDLVPVSAESRVSGVPIPIEEKPGIRLDPNKLAEVRKQTAEVSKILADIFSDDAEASEAPVAAQSKPLDGLDPLHTELLGYLETNSPVNRTEFEKMAKSLRLLPDAAIERINEWSFDHFDEPLLEDGDHITLAAHLRARLIKLREM